MRFGAAMALGIACAGTGLKVGSLNITLIFSFHTDNSGQQCRPRSGYHTLFTISSAECYNVLFPFFELFKCHIPLEPE